MIMPFGKHKGEDVGDLPDDYLMWMDENITFKSDDLEKAIYAEIEVRNLDIDL